MAVPNEAVLHDMVATGWGIQRMTAETMMHVSLREFFSMPEPGQRWLTTIFLPKIGEYDDGGGAAIAAYEFGLCPFAKRD